VHIDPINNNQNINSKAKISLLSEKNLLPQGAVQELVEKAKTVGKPEDTIHTVVQKNKWSGNTVIHSAFLKFPSSHFTHYIKTRVSGSFKEKQIQAFNVINEYIDSLKKEH
jgi:hypothetical protein